MCNYPEENNYSPNLAPRTEIANAYKLFVDTLPPKDSDDMMETNGLSDEDKNIPTITTETIEQATEAFDEMPTDEAPEEVNEASNTEFFEEDAPDEGVDESNPVKEAFAKVAQEVDEKLKCDCDGNCIKCECGCDRAKAHSSGIGSDDWKAETAIEYLQYRGVNQSNITDHLDVIDDVYNSLNEETRTLVISKAPWLKEVFVEATTRASQRQREQELEIAEEKSKCQAEKLTAKLEGKTGDWKADAEKAQHDAWTDLVKKWPTLSKDVQDVLDRIPGFAAFRNYIQGEMKSQAFAQTIDYDPEQTVKDMAKAHELGNISVADAAKYMNEPNMISEFAMGSNPELDQLNKERKEFSADNFSKAHDMFDKLQQQGVIPPTNKGEDPRLYATRVFDQFWKEAPNAGLGETVISGPMPCMTDIVRDGNGFGKGDCTVGDIFANEYRNYQRVNAECPIVPPKKPLTPEESLANLMTDLPKTMVNKILAIPSDDWKFQFDGDTFELYYSVASRTIRLSMFKKKLVDSTHMGSVFSLSFVNDGPGSVQYTRSFNALKDISAAGPNAKNLYQWFGKIIATFFSK